MISIKSINEYMRGDGFDFFDCGEEKLNEYLKKYARQNELRNISRTFLLLNNFEVMGYYTLSTAEISWNSISNKIRKGLPKYPIPSLRIARLAIDKKHQKKGFGKLLVKSIFLKALAISEEVGLHFIIVEPKEESIGFYELYGFKQISDSSKTMVLSLATIKKAIDQ